MAKMYCNIARVAVSEAIFAIDKPYDYLIPEEFVDKICIGGRVVVPFGRGNKRCEAMVLALDSAEKTPRMKEILRVLDEEPILDERALRLAYWIHERCFCSLYDVFRAQLPSGLWYSFKSVYKLKQGVTSNDVAGYLGDADTASRFLNGTVSCNELDKKIADKLISNNMIEIEDIATRKVSDKTVKIATLAISKDEAQKYIEKQGLRASLQRAILELLINIESASAAELCYFTGATTATINTLNRKGIISLSEKETFRRPKLSSKGARKEIELNDEQERAFDEISQKVNEEKPSCALLFGITGSGKTLVYMKLIEQVIEKGKGAIMLVPEIALTPQMVERFYTYFGDKIAILHSALSNGERFDEWKRIRRGEVSVVVGTRSAVFAPLENIGIIIMDEEQEHTYKSGNTPRYHARDVAKFRCVCDGATLLLGSATPSIESMYAAQSGKYSLHTIRSRFNQRNLPQVIIADMREELRSGNGGTIGSALARELSLNIERGEQSILFLNRRGQARYAVCRECGYSPECPNCSAALTYHSANDRFMCHLCGHSQEAVKTCPNCGEKLIFNGAGTQKLEDELKKLFPDVKVSRMDYDTTSAKTSHEALLSEFEREKIPILIGTQMITKGLDFENVTLVGVLSADQGLHVDDFRAQENTFSLITQVVGRAGRGEKRGRAVIQTFSPENPLIHQAAAQDYMSFYQNEISLRKMRDFPPFCDIISLMISGARENEVLYGSMRTLSTIRAALNHEYKDLKINIYGPAPASVLRMKGKYRYKLLICTENTRYVREMIARVICAFRADAKNRRLTITADTNSIDF